MKKSILLINRTIALLNYYSFDLGTYTTRDLMIKWSKKYPHFWLPLAVLEAIYQGRFKAISVEQILSLWYRYDHPNYQFNHDFEKLVSHNVYLDYDPIIPLEEKIKSQPIVNSNQLIKELEYQEKTNSGHDNNSNNSPLKNKSLIQNFQPIEDYSLCFSQLKLLAKLNNSTNSE